MSAILLFLIRIFSKKPIFVANESSEYDDHEASLGVPK